MSPVCCGSLPPLPLHQAAAPLPRMHMPATGCSRDGLAANGEAWVVGNRDQRCVLQPNAYGATLLKLIPSARASAASVLLTPSSVLLRRSSR
jgi:hypothetical protein